MYQNIFLLSALKIIPGDLLKNSAKNGDLINGAKVILEIDNNNEYDKDAVKILPYREQTVNIFLRFRVFPFFTIYPLLSLSW